MCWETSKVKPGWGWRTFCKTLSHTRRLKNISGATGSLLIFFTCIMTLQKFQDWILYLGKWSCLTWRLINIITHGLHVLYTQDKYLKEKTKLLTRKLFEIEDICTSCSLSHPYLVFHVSWYNLGCSSWEKNKPDNPKTQKMVRMFLYDLSKTHGRAECT